jgi:hypothetical protein
MELWALDDLNQIAPITTYTAVRIEERDLDAGTWSVTVPRNDGTRLADRWAAATWAGVEVYDPATGWRFGGFVDTVAEVRDAELGESVIFSGHDYQTLLQDRLEWPDYADEGAYWLTAGGTNRLTSWADYIVGTNAGSSALAYRRIPHLVMAADPAAGPDVERATSGRPLLEALRELFQGRTDWTIRLQFRRLTDGTPQLYYAPIARPVSPVVLSAETGAFTRYTSTERADAATHVISMGSTYIPAAPNRLISGPVTPSTDWRTRYSETFISRPQIDDIDRLNTDAYAYLATLARPASIDGLTIDAGFGNRLDIGWLIDVATGSSFGATLDRLPVAQATLAWDPERGWTRTVAAGTAPAAGPEAAVYAGLASLSRRLRYMEFGLR